MTTEGRSGVRARKPIIDFSGANPWWHTLSLLGGGLAFVGDAWHRPQLAGFGGGMGMAFLIGATIAGLREDLRESLKDRMSLVWRIACAGIALGTIAGWIWG